MEIIVYTKADDLDRFEGAIASVMTSENDRVLLRNPKHFDRDDLEAMGHVIVTDRRDIVEAYAAKGRKAVLVDDDAPKPESIPQEAAEPPEAPSEPAIEPTTEPPKRKRGRPRKK